MDFKYFNIADNISLDDLKNQYRKLSKQYHPDLGGSTEDFQQVNHEYRQALEFIKRRAFRENNIDLFKLINEQIYSIDGYIKKLDVPEPFKPAISYLVEKGINELGRVIKQKINQHEVK